MVGRGERRTQEKEERRARECNDDGYQAGRKIKNK